MRNQLLRAKQVGAKVILIRLNKPEEIGIQWVYGANIIRTQWKNAFVVCMQSRKLKKRGKWNRDRRFDHLDHDIAHRTKSSLVRNFLMLVVVFFCSSLTLSLFFSLLFHTIESLFWFYSVDQVCNFVTLLWVMRGRH